MTAHRTVALIVAAGQGNRMGGPPKQFLPLGGKPVTAHSHAAFSAHPGIDAVLTVISADQEPALIAALGAVPHVMGGATRRQSVWNGLSALAAKAPTRILIHDAARPFVPTRVIDLLLAALDESEGAVPALAVADTLAHANGCLGDTVPRDGLVRVQTPQAFRYDAIVAIGLIVDAGIYRHEFVADAVISGMMRVQLDTGIPIFSCVLTPQQFDESEERIALFRDHLALKGREVGNACLQMLDALASVHR